MDIQNFIAEFKKTFVYDLLSMTLKDEQLFEHFVDGDKVIWFKEQTRQMWEMWQQAQKVAVPEWISIEDHIPKEGEEVFVHHLGQIKQATKDKNYRGGFKSRNCYGWESVSCSISHWMPKNIELPESYHFYYENDAKQKAMIEAVENKE